MSNDGRPCEIRDTWPHLQDLKLSHGQRWREEKGKRRVTLFFLYRYITCERTCPSPSARAGVLLGLGLISLTAHGDAGPFTDCEDTAPSLGGPALCACGWTYAYTCI